MKRLLLIIVLVVAAIAGLFVALRLPSADRHAFVRTTGRVEGTSAAVVTRAGGRVAEILVGVGEPVTRGQTVARLEPVDVEDLAAAGAQARQHLAVLDARLRAEQAELAVLQTRVPMAVRAAETAANLARAVLQQCETLADQQGQEVERLRGVEEPDDEVRLRLEEAELAHEQAQQDVVIAQASVEHAEGDLEAARLGEQEVGALIQEVEALRAERDAAQVNLDATVGTDKGMPVIALSAGLVAARHVTVGTHVPAGTALLELVNPDSFVIRAQVGAEEAKLLTVGQEARVYLDGAPADASDSVVSMLAPDGSGALGAWMLTVPAPRGSRPILGLSAEIVVRVRGDAAWPAPRQ